MRSMHHEVKPFMCDVCDFTCAKISNLNIHRRRIHSATENLTLSHYGDDMTWKKVETMFSTPTIQENPIVQEKEHIEVTATTNEDGEIVFWENTENQELFVYQ